LVAVGAKGNLDDLAALRSRGDAQLRRLGDAEAEIDLTDGAGSAGDTRRGKHHDIVDIEPPTDGRQLRARAQLGQMRARGSASSTSRWLTRPAACSMRTASRPTCCSNDSDAKRWASPTS